MVKAELEFLKGKCIKNNKQFVLEICKLLKIANEDGLTNEDIQLIVNVLLQESVDGSVFEKLVLCMIPEGDVSSDIVNKVILWVISFYREEDENKISSLLYWIGVLMNYKIIDREVVDRYYSFFFSMLEYHPKPICHLLYMLTKPCDVQMWKVLKCLRIMKLFGAENHFCVLLTLFKKYKPELVTKDIPNCKSEIPFSCRSKFYTNLRLSFKNISNRKALVNNSFHQCTVVSYGQKKMLTWFPSIGYEIKGTMDSELNINIRSRLETLAISSNTEKPTEILHMLQSQTGICCLSFSNATVKEKFSCKLFAALEQGFISKDKDIDDNEREDLLTKIIQLHQFCLQGLKPVSDFLTIYLKFWNGYSFKYQIYKLIEWFAFTSTQELNCNLLWPLYMLFVSSRPIQMCEILCCITSLVTNLYISIEREHTNSFRLFPYCGVESKKLVPILNSLSEYVKQLLNIGLINFPCNCNLLTVGITYYEKVFYLERHYKLPVFTVFSQVIVYQSLLSPNILHINRICGLILRYKDLYTSLSSSPIPQIHRKIMLLEFYIKDIYNALWSSQLLKDRENGCMFSDLSEEEVNKLCHVVNLDTAFKITHHIMFQPYRCQIAHNLKSPYKTKTKEELLELLKPVIPHIAELLDYMNSLEVFNVNGNEH